MKLINVGLAVEKLRSVGMENIAIKVETFLERDANETNEFDMARLKRELKIQFGDQNGGFFFENFKGLIERANNAQSDLLCIRIEDATAWLASIKNAGHGAFSDQTMERGLAMKKAGHNGFKNWPHNCIINYIGFAGLLEHELGGDDAIKIRSLTEAFGRKVPCIYD